LTQVNAELATDVAVNQAGNQAGNPGEASFDTSQQAEAALQQVLQAAQTDLPIWEDWATF